MKFAVLQYFLFYKKNFTTYSVFNIFLLMTELNKTFKKLFRVIQLKSVFLFTLKNISTLQYGFRFAQNS